MNLKGTLPPLILQVLESGPKHGYVIAQEIKAKSKGVLDFKEGTLYPALHAQENKGLIASYEQTEKGRLRRYYKLTEEGHKALQKDRQEWKQLSGAISLILEGT
jgi:transcriptional regulator